MSGKHNPYEQIARTRRGSAGYREGYDEARSCAGTAAGAGPVADRTGRPRRHDPARPIPSGGRRGGAHPPTARPRRRRPRRRPHRHPLPARRLSTASVGAVPPERQLANSGGTCPTRWRRGTSTYREVPLKSAAVAGRRPVAQRLRGLSGGSTPPLPTDQAEPPGLSAFWSRTVCLGGAPVLRACAGRQHAWAGVSLDPTVERHGRIGLHADQYRPELVLILVAEVDLTERPS